MKCKRFISLSFKTLHLDSEVRAYCTRAPREPIPIIYANIAFRVMHARHIHAHIHTSTRSFTHSLLDL